MRPLFLETAHVVFIPGEEHSVWGCFFFVVVVFLSDGAARTLFSMQDFAKQVLKWLISVFWLTICLHNVSLQKTLGLNRTAHRNAFITTVFKRTGGLQLINDFKGFFSFFFFFYQQMISVFFLKDLLHEPSARESRDVKTEPGVSSGCPNSEWLKKRWSWKTLWGFQIVFFLFFAVKMFFFSFSHICV